MKLNFNCLDCGINTSKIKEYYMVKDTLWVSVVPNQKGMLCIGCLEKRLGRSLTLTDFFACPLTFEVNRKSNRLRDRLGPLVFETNMQKGNFIKEAEAFLTDEKNPILILYLILKHRDPKLASELLGTEYYNRDDVINNLNVDMILRTIDHNYPGNPLLVNWWLER